MSILHSLSLEIKSKQLELIIVRLSELKAFSGVQEVGLGDGGLIDPPEGYEVLEFGSAAAASFDEHCRKSQGNDDLVRVLLYFELETLNEFSELKAEVGSLLASMKVDISLGLWETLKPEDYLENYKQNSSASEFGDFWVGPPWKEANLRKKYRYVVEPGMAFGTGDHPTTQMCLERLNEIAENEFVVNIFLDLGTGSGVLALHAKRLFPTALAWASDLDPHCAEEFKKTFAMNQQDPASVTVRFGNTAVLSRLRDELKQVDLLISNIYSEVLATLVEDARKLLSPGGIWLISGVLAGKPEQELMDSASKHFQVQERWTQQKLGEEDSWVCLILK